MASKMKKSRFSVSRKSTETRKGHSKLSLETRHDHLISKCLILHPQITVSKLHFKMSLVDVFFYYYLEYTI